MGLREEYIYASSRLTETRLNGKLHSFDNHPASVDSRKRAWFSHDLPHREDGPAVITKCSKEWWQHGKRHRNNNKPALIAFFNDLPNLTQRTVQLNVAREEYWVDGQRHRTDGPAVIQYAKRRDGSKYVLSSEYYFEGLPHNVEERPSCFPGRKKEWWNTGSLHREGNPAVVIGDNEEYSGLLMV